MALLFHDDKVSLSGPGAKMVESKQSEDKLAITVLDADPKEELALLESRSNMEMASPIKCHLLLSPLNKFQKHDASLDLGRRGPTCGRENFC